MSTRDPGRACARSTASRPSTSQVVWDPVWTHGPPVASRPATKLAMPLEELEPYRAATERQPDGHHRDRPPSGARERKVDAFVFDCVCHIFNFDQANALGPPGRDVRRAPLRLPPAAHRARARRSSRARSSCSEWSVDEIYEMVIEGSDTDMIVAQPLPLTDLFHDGLSPWEKCAEMAAKHPDRAVFWGSVNPLEGKKALDLMDAPGRGLRRQGVQVLQRPLRLRPAVPVAHGRPARSPSRCSSRRRSSAST